MKLGIRDLLWLILLVACVTAWRIDHRKVAMEIDKSRLNTWFIRLDRNEKPSDREVKRRAAATKLATLSDDELDAYLGRLSLAHRPPREAEYEPCVVEMARRRLADKLQARYDALMAQPHDVSRFEFPDNLELLTAIRRAQARPDPLIIHLGLDHSEGRGNGPGTPRLTATIENVDSGGEAVNLHQGGDDRGGRREKWRFKLTDLHGQVVADSNFEPINGGGLGSFGPLPAGETGDWKYFFDLRSYVAPPATGSYRLQALYHNSVGIASQRDVSGLIVTKSEPLSVWIENPSPRGTDTRVKTSRPTIPVLAACFGLLAISMVTGNERAKRDQSTSTWIAGLRALCRRDNCWAALVCSLVAWMTFDGWQQSKELIDVQPDAAASWSIRLADETAP